MAGKPGRPSNKVKEEVTNVTIQEEKTSNTLDNVVEPQSTSLPEVDDLTEIPTEESSEFIDVGSLLENLNSSHPCNCCVAMRSRVKIFEASSKVMLETQINNYLETVENSDIEIYPQLEELRVTSYVITGKPVIIAILPIQEEVTG